ncbi:MAG: nuclear transport factor 2 family protein [Ignavibacteria bacterium]|nr:nuclear transport factor 2 family protein [Ignavibacteria bacterium]
MKQLVYFSISVILIIFTLPACKPGEKIFLEKRKQEIRETEAEFCKMAAERGLAEAFAHFADTSATIKISAGKDIIHGKEAIFKRYSHPLFQNSSLTWAPDFVDVSQSGDLGYSYGHYTFTNTDTTGKSDTSTGIFMTVWKRQNDHTWRFVWD